jgi:hypothetical protein
MIFQVTSDIRCVFVFELIVLLFYFLLLLATDLCAYLRILLLNQYVSRI